MYVYISSRGRISFIISIFPRLNWGRYVSRTDKGLHSTFESIWRALYIPAVFNAFSAICGHDLDPALSQDS